MTEETEAEIAAIHALAAAEAESEGSIFDAESLPPGVTTEIPLAGTTVYDAQGTEWTVYLQEVQVKCVRLRTPGPGGENIYLDVPHASFLHIS